MKNQKKILIFYEVTQYVNTAFSMYFCGSKTIVKSERKTD